jgi:cyclic pyranopterin phosphate synthase
MATAPQQGAPLVDPFGRRVSYLRLSVTDRCDLRCTYCMPERMEFLPKAEVLTLEELARLAEAFIRRGVTKIRLTGGEPLVRRDILTLVGRLGRHLAPASQLPSPRRRGSITTTSCDSAEAAVAMDPRLRGEGEKDDELIGTLSELTLTTNATLLARHAEALKAAGIARINVSLDSLNPERFRAITRRGDLGVVVDGIEAARGAGLKVKLNMVALKGVNEDEIEAVIAWAHGRGMELTLIETMPMGEIAHRAENYLSLREVRARLEERWTLRDLSDRTGGPARYVRVEETGGRLGFITPLSHNFCEACNRVRVTCTGELFLCLGQEAKADLRNPLRASRGDELLDAAITEAIARKPRGHDFDAARLARPAVARTMSLTGG